MINKKQLCKFLVKAKKSTYAAGEMAKKIFEAALPLTSIVFSIKLYYWFFLGLLK